MGVTFYCDGFVVHDLVTSFLVMQLTSKKDIGHHHFVGQSYNAFGTPFVTATPF